MDAPNRANRSGRVYLTTVAICAGLSLSMKLGLGPDWEETAHILEDAYRLATSKTLVKKLDEQ